MAVTTEYSTEYLKKTDPRTYGYLSTNDQQIPMFMQPFTFTQGAAAGDANSLQYLWQFPPGRIVFFPKLSFYQWAAFGASRVLDIGHAAYTNESGTTVAASANRFDDNVDVSSAGSALMGSDQVIADAPGIEFVSTSGVDIYATVTGGTIPAGTVISGYLVYAHVG